MPLNILHHKSWNVYNTENIERVRRDEAKAKEEEQKKKEKAIQAEREFRLSLLRKKNSISTDSKSTTDKLPLDNHLNENGHINLFYEEEQQLKSGKNEEREEEERKQKEKFESQFIYSLTGKDKVKPWYSLDKTSQSSVVDNGKNEKDSNKLKKIRKDKKRKEIEDPLELIKKNLAKDKEIEQKIKESIPTYSREKIYSNDNIHNHETFTNPTKLLKKFSKNGIPIDNSDSSFSDTSSDSSSESDISSSSSESYKKRKRSKRHRHHSHHRRRHKHSHDHDSKSKSSKKHSKKKRKRHHEREENISEGKSVIEKLREERLKREQEERQKALHVNGALKPQTPTVNKIEEDKYFYNSQFNPESIRQLKKK